MTKYIFLLLLILIIVPMAHAEDSLPIGYIEIPSISLYRPIYSIPLVDKNYDLSGLGYGLGLVGRLEQGVWGHWIHDDTGKVILVGHNPGAFIDLPTVQIGDRIIVGDTDGAVEYIVVATHIVEVTEVQWLGTSPYKMLLLQTCYGNQRWLVEAIPNTQMP